MNNFLLGFPPLFQKGIDLFNSEEFYAQHDVLESLWRETPKEDPHRGLYQGVLNIGVGFYLYSREETEINKNRRNGAIKQLEKGLGRLGTFLQIMTVSQSFSSGDLLWLEEFIITTKKWLLWLKSSTDHTPPFSFPKISTRA